MSLPIGPPPQVIIFTGLPGTGKSTLAEPVARHRCPFLGPLVPGRVRLLGHAIEPADDNLRRVLAYIAP